MNGFYIVSSIVLLLNRFPKRKIKLENILICHEKKYGNCKVVYKENLKKLVTLYLLHKNYNVSNKKLANFFVSGLIDKDKGFSLSFKKRKLIKPTFYFSQESNNPAIFILLQSFFNGGKIYKVAFCYYRFLISDRKTILCKLIPHFTKYKLVSEKKIYFEIFKKAVNELQKKNNLFAPENESLLKLCYSMNFKGKQRKNFLEYLPNSVS